MEQVGFEGAIIVFAHSASVFKHSRQGISNQLVYYLESYERIMRRVKFGL